MPLVCNRFGEHDGFVEPFAAGDLILNLRSGQQPKGTVVCSGATDTWRCYNLVARFELETESV